MGCQTLCLSQRRSNKKYKYNFLRSNIDSLPESFTACVPTSDFETGFSEILTAWIQEKEAKKKKPKKKKENVVGAFFALILISKI